MLDAAAIVVELAEREQRDSEGKWRPGKSDVLRWVDGDLERVGPLLDEAAAILARAYGQDGLTFEFCDDVVNGLYAAFMELSLTEMPPLFYDVFLAFDAGEYPHDGDEAAVDPVAKYT